MPLRSLFEETLRFVKGQLPSSVGIKLDIPGDLTITADKQRIQQAFLNLIKNGIEAIPVEGTISISARKHHAIDRPATTRGSPII